MKLSLMCRRNPSEAEGERERTGDNQRDFKKERKETGIRKVGMNRMVGSYVWSVLKDFKEYFLKTMMLMQDDLLLFFVIKDIMVSLNFYE